MGDNLGKDLAFEIVEYKARIEKVRERMQARGIRCLLVHTPENLHYLTGQDSPGYYAYQCAAITMDRDPVILVRAGVEDVGAKYYCWTDDVVGYNYLEDPIQKTADLVTERGYATGRIGIETDSWFLTYLGIEQLKSCLRDATFVPADGLVESCRVVKSPSEIELIRKAAGLVSETMMHAVDSIEVGRTENEVAAEIHRFMTLNGCDWTGLPTFIASGPRTTLGHPIWTSRRIEKTDRVHLELPFAIRKYHAASMRPVFVGEPSAEHKKIVKVVVEALNTGIERIKPGASQMDSFHAAKKVIDDAGYGKYFGRRFGYSIGIAFPPDWGEGTIMSIGPRLWGTGSDIETFQPNMTFHLVPGIAIPGQIQVAISETVRVTETGCEVLTKVPQEILVR